jgi:hypothetical protein
VGNSESDRTREVDYRTLFLGACAVISILGGGYWSYYTTQQSAANDDMERTNQLQWQRLQVINDLVLSHTAHIGSLEKNHDDQEDRIRKLESDVAGMAARRK